MHQFMSKFRWAVVRILWQEPIVYMTHRTFLTTAQAILTGCGWSTSMQVPNTTVRDDLLFELEEIEHHPQHPMELSPFNSRLQRLLSSKTGANTKSWGSYMAGTMAIMSPWLLHTSGQMAHEDPFWYVVNVSQSQVQLWQVLHSFLPRFQKLPTSSAKRRDDHWWVSTKEAKASWSSAGTAWKQHERGMTVMMTLQHPVAQSGHPLRLLEALEKPEWQRRATTRSNFVLCTSHHFPTLTRRSRASPSTKTSPCPTGSAVARLLPKTWSSDRDMRVHLCRLCQTALTSLYNLVEGKKMSF